MRGRRGTVVPLLCALVLAGCAQGSGATVSSTPAPSDGAPWTPEQGFITEAQLPAALSALVAAPAQVRSATVQQQPGTGCVTPYAPEVVCGPPQVSVVLDVVEGAQETRITVIESAEPDRNPGLARCQPDARVVDWPVHPTPGYHCVDTLPWTESGGMWMTTQRVGNRLDECRDEVVVRRGRTSVLVREPLPAPWCATGQVGDAAVPLTDAQLLTLASAAPLVDALAVWSTVPPRPAYSPTPSG